MKEAALKKIVSQLNNINISGFEGIKLGDSLYYALYYYEKKSFIYEFKAILAPILKGHYEFDRIGDNGIVFLYSSAYADRNDHREKFDKVTSTVKNSSVVSYHAGHCLKNILKLPKIIQVLKKTKGIDAEPQLRRFIAYWIFSYACERDEIYKLLAKKFIKVRAFVSYCDVMPIDSVLIQHYKKERVTTLTLQHGQFSAGIEIGRVAYEKSYSDFFLCFGEYTKYICRELMLDQNKMIPLGPPEMIGKKLPTAMNDLNKRAFGVVMSYFEFREENIRLLKCAEMVAKEFNIKTLIRLHPSLEYKDYCEYIDEDLMEVRDKRESMDSFIQSVDFGIVGSSSVFQTFVVCLVPIYRYAANSKQDAFKDIDWCVFSEEKKIIGMLKELYNNKKEVENCLINTRNRLVGEGNISNNYKKFFEKLLENLEKHE